MKPMFVMLVGLPASGKSTYRNTADYGDFVHVSTDDLVDAAAREQGVTYDALWSDMIKDATVTAQQIFRDAVKARKSIIWDQTNLTAKKRRGVLSQVPGDYLKVAVFFEIGEELRQQRVANRPGKTIPAHVQDSMAASYARPSVEEGFDYVWDAAFPSHVRGAA